jgi:hypothetical protein
LRLDDGSLIGPSSHLGGSSDGPMRLTVDRALAFNSASDKEVQRLERLLASAKQHGLAIAQPERPERPPITPRRAKRPSSE